MSKEDFNELRDILLEASGVFLEYALIHNKKGNDDKSTRNNILSEKQDRALKLLRGIYQERTFTKEDVEKAAKAYYEQEPWTYRDRVPTTMLSPAYEIKEIAIEWKEFDEDGSGRSDKAVMIKRMTAALNAIGKIEE